MCSNAADMVAVPIWAWVAFLGFVLGMLALDLGVFHRKAHAVKLREAAAWAAVWVSLSLAFGSLVWLWRGKTAGLEFLTGYLIEEALSVDNLFVFLVIFNYFSLPARLYHKVLVWGILGAIVLRGVMIGLGAALVARFDWVLYIFGVFLIYTAFKLATQRDEKADLEDKWVIRIARRVWPLTTTYRGGRFFARLRDGRWAMTPLFVTVLAVESTDVVFALDSIPAIFAVTRDPFIVYTSNICAILGLRAVFFLIAGVIHRFRYLRAGLSLILGVIGLKMLTEHWIHVPVPVSLGLVGGILGASVGLSLLADWRGKRATGVQGTKYKVRSSRKR